VLLRWCMVAGCLVAVLVGDRLALHLEKGILIGVALLLAVANLIFTWVIRAFKNRQTESCGVRPLVISQTLVDLFALSCVSYVLGGIELPVLVLFLGEIIIVTLFCHRKVSLLITLVAACFAALPLLLEHRGVIPPLSLFGSPYQESLIADPRFAGAYMTFLLLAFLFFWYLVSEITVSLRLRELQLQRAHEKLLLLDREKTRATLLATHELKAPLAAISSYVYTLRDGYCGELPEQARQVVERIGKRADMLVKKIFDIILLSNLKTQVVKNERFKVFELNGFLAQELAEARELAAQHEIQVVDRLATQPVYYICGIREQLHTLMSNLLRNAITYSRPGGRVEVSLEGRRDRVTVVVRDHGIGIPREKIERIFDEHFRTNDAARHNPDGTGLGLPIVREIARLHHALVRVRIPDDGGSEFRVTFRRQTQPQAEGAPDGKDSDH